MNEWLHSPYHFLEFFFFLNYLLLHWVFGLLCAGFSLVAQSGDYSLIVVHGLLIAVAYLAVEHGL